jgi:uncharacterized protein
VRWILPPPAAQLRKSRLPMVDALRGYALMGLFLVHMEEHFELYWSHPHPHPAASAHLVFALFMGKAFSVLALCFGFSFFVMMENARRNARPFALRFAWRLALLAIIGSFHSLLYRGDIMVLLALGGLVLIPSNRIRWNGALVAMAAVCLLQPYLLLWIAAGLAGAPWALAPAHYASDPAMHAYLSGSFADVLEANMGAGQLNKWWFFIESGRCAQVLGLFLLGLVLGRIGFFSEPERYRRIRAIALAACTAVILIVHVVRPHDGGFVTGPVFWIGTLLSSWSDLAQMGASVLIFIPLWEAGGDRLLRLLAPVGRMTLTLYVAQSLLFVPVFYGFGLGVDRWMTPSQSLAVGLVSFAAQVVFANLWFRKFHYGPLEWGWRSATKLSLDVPFRRTQTQSVL